MNSLFFLISWLSDTFFVFVTLALIVQGVLGSFRIKSYRFRAFIRMIPGMALLFMPFLNLFKIGRFLNPLSCDGWLQKLIVYFFSPIKNYLTIPNEIITQYVLVKPFISIVGVFIGLFIAITVVMFLRKIFQIFLSSVQLRLFIRKAKEYSQEIRNPWLISQLRQHRIRVLISDLITIPMAIGSRTILVSQTALEQLQQGELESVIGHEVAHLIAKDPWTRLFHQLLKAFFWWIPMRNWLKRIEEDQEIACDQTVQKYQEGIGSALVKITRHTRHSKEKELPATFCNFSNRSLFILIRLEMILGINRIQERSFSQGIVPLIAGPLIILSCTV